VIVVQPGKTIDLYVVDFSLTSRYLELITPNDDNDVDKPHAIDDDDDDDDDDDADDEDDYCHVYVYVRDLPSQGQIQGQVQSQAQDQAEGQPQTYAVNKVPTPVQHQGQGRIQGRQDESQGHEEVKICAGSRRERRVYSSVSNTLSVRLSPLVFEDASVNFLLKYIGNFLSFSFIFYITNTFCYP